MSDLIPRLGSELRDAAERQTARRGLRRLLPSGGRPERRGGRGPIAWLRRRSGRTLLLAGGVTVALAGVGGAAGLLAGRGEVGGPPTLTYVRLTAEQRAAGLRETTRPVVIGRGRQPHSGWSWQLIAFQTTSGLCVAIDFPAIANIGGGCAVDVPREGRAIDWQGYLDRLGGRGPSTLLGAVSPAAARVTLAHGHGERRVAEPARIVRMHDRRLLDAIGVERPFALWVGEVTEANPMARAVAFDGAGRELGAVGIPNGGAGSAGFLPRGCEPPGIDDVTLSDAALPFPPAIREGYGALRRAQRPDDRPAWLVRRLLGRGDPRGRFARPFLMPYRGEIDLGALRRTGTAPDGRPLFLVTMRRQLPKPPDGCLRSTTPRLRREAARLERVRRRVAREVHVMLVDSRLAIYGGITSDRVRGGWGSRSAGRRRGWSLVHGIVPDAAATVELAFADGLRRTVTVRGNLAAVSVPRGAGRVRVVGETWRDRAGRVVWRGRR
ncbi:hypothetical protein [Conexibacter arvalis]|uniref:Uncharacterized protein n=1 Tax=Conexibacter arvalis TaxID=912552 RepID=A0A840IHQ9_9ACTN|nr:hypothetical protein [Conexibacter arvalis]MBB4663488.1 hypothetical protein [Conexibacter arvalis]